MIVTMINILSLAIQKCLTASGNNISTINGVPCNISYIYCCTWCSFKNLNSKILTGYIIKKYRSIIVWGEDADINNDGNIGLEDLIIFTRIILGL